MPKPRKAAKMTGAQYMSALKSLELNQVSAAAFLQVSVRTSHGYANGCVNPRRNGKAASLDGQAGPKPEDVR